MQLICKRDCTLPKTDAYRGGILEQGASFDFPDLEVWDLKKYPYLKHFERPEGIKDPKPEKASEAKTSKPKPKPKPVVKEETAVDLEEDGDFLDK